MGLLKDHVQFFGELILGRASMDMFRPCTICTKITDRVFVFRLKDRIEAGDFSSLIICDDCFTFMKQVQTNSQPIDVSKIEVVENENSKG